MKVIGGGKGFGKTYEHCKDAASLLSAGRIVRIICLTKQNAERVRDCILNFIPESRRAEAGARLEIFSSDNGGAMTDSLRSSVNHDR